MGCFEEKVVHLLEQNVDIAMGIRDIVDRCLGDGLHSISPEIICEVMRRLKGNAHEEDAWDKLLSAISSESISDEVIDYLVHNGISVMTLCHMKLQDKWLMQLIEHDEAPLYTLAERYYLSDQYSTVDFIRFYHQYLHCRHDISLHLLELYRDAKKRKLLIFLCTSDKDFGNEKKLEWYIIADQVITMIDEKVIVDIYERYKNVGIVMLAIAENYFTPENILLELSTMKGIAYATEIRKKSREALKLIKLSLKE